MLQILQEDLTDLASCFLDVLELEDKCNGQTGHQADQRHCQTDFA